MRLVPLLCLLLALARPVGAEACRQALVLALDVSGSVNEKEYQQQVSGLAWALSDPQVRSLLLDSSAPPVAIAVFEWSSRNHQLLIQPWALIDSAATLDQVVARIQGHRKQRAGLKTALGTALSYAAQLLKAQPQCWQHTVDVSGDGRNNIGPTPRDAYARGFANVTVNALVVTDIERDESRLGLVRYFQTQVLHGPDAFTMVAEGYGDYARAMRLKLIRELAVPVFGALPR